MKEPWPSAEGYKYPLFPEGQVPPHRSKNFQLGASRNGPFLISSTNFLLQNRPNRTANTSSSTYKNDTYITAPRRWPPTCRGAAFNRLISLFLFCLVFAMALEASTFETLTPSRFISFTIPNPSSSSHALLRVAVLDSPLQPTHSPHVAAMLVPQGRETDWIFSTKSGHLQLLFASPLLSRFILIGLVKTSSPSFVSQIFV
ncbi:unnamed protein product [Vicia faba]|uniref:Uncharacterized protein n=1 Tax=Vicia faba TaxID=3906 RepID=A0AAV0ZYZ1_VICFA|nr:unnamed protein product [Vicia faba]